MLLNTSISFAFNVFMCAFAYFELLYYIFIYIVLVLNLRLAWVFDSQKKKVRNLVILFFFYNSFNIKNMTLKVETPHFVEREKGGYKRERKLRNCKSTTYIN